MLAGDIPGHLEVEDAPVVRGGEVFAGDQRQHPHHAQRRRPPRLRCHPSASPTTIQHSHHWHLGGCQGVVCKIESGDGLTAAVAGDRRTGWQAVADGQAADGGGSDLLTGTSFCRDSASLEDDFQSIWSLTTSKLVSLLKAASTFNGKC
ncbi:hypothetical protein PCASD_04933 [Puccinia coronata f. sp. avenae]|uniref:Uncharacterized protein n=1 Tax=Puccinia coronata f. sp. avenae TaxID=200324 RepID=A0A2N5VD80_9BASI|nr:hypothetical protein PCASD_04933 [Puccinia coronata f. sp. avenae]